MSCWKRVSREHPCVVCNRPDWCMYVGPGASPTAAICPRVRSEKQCGKAGWYHRLSGDVRRLPRLLAPKKAIASADFGSLTDQYFSLLGDGGRAFLGRLLGVSAESLRRLRVGRSPEHRSYSFPMSDVASRVIGIRLRRSSGRKFCVKGSREGLFIPRGVDLAGQLAIAEGPSDVAALLDLRIDAVGRPSCRGGVHLIVKLLVTNRPKHVVLVADGDEPGREGAKDLAIALVAKGVPVSTITPPPGTKDVREWKARGATRDDVIRAIAEAEVITPVPIAVRRAYAHAVAHRVKVRRRMPR